MAHGFALFAATSPDVIRASAREAEALGYSSFWVNHPGPTDGLAALALAAGETRRIDLGVGVVPLHTRGPDSIAEGVRATRLPLDRLLLGVGSPNPEALKRVRAGVAALRSEPSPAGSSSPRSDRRCAASPARSPTACSSTGSLPDYARRSAELVREGAASAGRKPPRVYAYVRLALGEPAREKLAEEGARYAAIPAYSDNFKRMGVDPVVDRHRRADARRCPARARGVARRRRRGRAPRHHGERHRRREPRADQGRRRRIGTIAPLSLSGRGLG